MLSDYAFVNGGGYCIFYFTIVKAILDKLLIFVLQTSIQASIESKSKWNPGGQVAYKFEW